MASFQRGHAMAHSIIGRLTDHSGSLKSGRLGCVEANCGSGCLTPAQELNHQEPNQQKAQPPHHHPVSPLELITQNEIYLTRIYAGIWKHL